MDDTPPARGDLPDSPRHVPSAPEDRWWHYVGALALILAIVVLSVVALQLAD